MFYYLSKSKYSEFLSFYIYFFNFFIYSFFFIFVRWGVGGRGGGINMKLNQCCIFSGIGRYY